MPTRSTFTTTGTYAAHPRGFGFVTFPEPVTVNGVAIDSAFVTPPDARKLMTDDLLEVRVDGSDGRGTVTHVVSTTRVRTTVFGQVVRSRTGSDLMLVPDPHVGSGQVKIPTSAGTAGQWVLYDLTTRTTLAAYPELNPAAVRHMLFARHTTPLGHTPAVTAEAEQLATKATAALRRAPGPHRLDLTTLPTITIDGPTSLDLDDAISVVADGENYRVWVHVADVAAHVPAGSATDVAAREVATSVYLPKWNRPMLPRTLSEAAISLLPGVARDALSVAYTVTPAGAVLDADVVRTRIISDAKLTYEHTAAVLDGTATGPGLAPELTRLLRDADTAAARIGDERDARTAHQSSYANDATREAGVKVRATAGEDAYDGAEFTSVAVDPAYRTEQLIERLMVAANESVAAWLTGNNLPGVFRTHPEPSPDLADDMDAFVSHLPRALRTPVTAGDDQLARLAELAGRLGADGAFAVSSLLLRNTGRASYVAEPGLHFGLTSHGYVHFTSPLRRYADLMVHRIIHAALDDQSATVEQLRTQVEEVCVHVTQASARAARIESQFRRFASARVFGASERLMDGVISGFAAKAMFVTVPETGLSGSLPFTALTGRWETDDRKVAATEATSGNVLRIGDPIRVQVADVEYPAAAVTFARRARRKR